MILHLLKKRVTTRGHNLLEVIVASFIFSTAIVIMVGVWGIYHQALTQNKARIMAMAVARSELESRLALGYTNLIPHFGTSNIQTFEYDFESWVRGRQVILPLYGQALVVDCSTVPVNPCPRLAHVIVNVTWAETSGNHTTVYDAYVFDSR